MYFLNLTLGQFLAVFGGVGLGVVALYLWDRSRRRVTVPTLRFWRDSQQPAQIKHRRRIQQPWSLLLQLAGIALLLLAIAQMRLGSPAEAARDHVVVLDTSAWMAARAKGGTLMDAARAGARAFVRAMPPGDRVMLVRADALATPATAFESKRQALDDAIAASKPGATALNLEQALEFARQAQRLQGGNPGEIVYIGHGRTAGATAETLCSGCSLRVIPIDAPVSNCGLHSIGLKRSQAEPDVWEVLVDVRNYGRDSRAVTLALAFGGTLVGTRELTLAGGAAQSASFRLRARAGGWLEARVAPSDDLESNHRAVIEVPPRSSVKITVYSQEPDLLRPVFAASPEVDATFRSPAQYTSSDGADLVILDRFSPAQPPSKPAIWIEPPEAGSPVRVRMVTTDAPLTHWRSDHPLAAGLRTRDVRLDSTEILQPASSDTVIASSEAGPVAVARDRAPKMFAIGFHPVRTRMRYELATPLLFANAIRWMHPEAFRRRELYAGNAGMVSVTAGPESERAEVKVVSQSGTPLPYTRHGRTVRFFVASPGVVRVLTAEGESVHSLVLPELAENVWTPPRGVRRGLPPPRIGPNYRELWPWLALAGALLLLLEWLKYGRRRLALARTPHTVPSRRLKARSVFASIRGFFV